MKKTDAGSSVGVDDPYDVVDRCDHLTDDGRCRFAIEQADRDPAFASERRAEEYRCPVAGDPEAEGPTGEWDWQDCPHFRCRDHSRECVRCGLTEQRMAHDDSRPLLEEHHLSYPDGSGPAHEITVYLCRWCHATVHNSWGRIDDDVAPAAEAIAAREARRASQQREHAFESAAERYERE